MPERKEEGFFQSLFAPIESPEDAKIISLQHARRGGMLGVKIGAGMVGAAALIEIGMAPFSPDHFAEITKGNFPLEIVKAAGFFGGTLGVMGAVIDGFSPTSRFVKRCIQREVDSCKEIRDATVSTYKFFKGLDYPKLAYDIFRPDVPRVFLENKLKFLAGSTAIGAAGGSIFVGTIEISTLMDKLPSVIGLPNTPNPYINALAEHNGDIIKIGAGLGFTAAAYMLAFHRPIHI